MPFRIAICLASALTLWSVSEPTYGQSLAAGKQLKKETEKLAQPYIDSKTVVGMSIGMIQGDQQTTIHLGRRNVKGSKPNDQTLYEIGSISKVFTSLLLAEAVVNRQVTLKQHAQDFLPKGAAMPAVKGRPIHLLDLATHVSGLPRLSDNMPFGNANNPYEDYPSKLAYAFLAKHQLQHAPGEHSAYSNFGAALLGKLLCNQADSTYQKLLKEKIADPCKMKSTMIRVPARHRPRFANPFTADGTPSSRWDFADMPGAGGIRSSISDMVAFANVQLRSDTNHPLHDAIELAWKEQPQTAGNRMGLGWQIAGDGHTRWHNGQTGGYHSMLMINRQNETAVVILANTATSEVDKLASQIMRLLAGKAVQPKTFPKEVAVSAKTMQGYAGKYQLAPQFIFTVSEDDGKLMVGLTGQSTHQVYPKSKTKWFYKVVEAELTFNVNERGKAESLELFQNGVRQTAKRIE